MLLSEGLITQAQLDAALKAQAERGLPIGQLLWQKELMSYIDYPPLQLAASYNLQQVLDQVREMSKDHPSQ